MDYARRHLVTALAVLGAAALPPRMAQAGAPARAATGDAPRPGGREAFVARSADGTTLAGEAAGDPGAPEVLFIHGLRQSRLSWDRQFADPALGAFRLVRFDLRGHGDSDKPDAPASYADPDLWADDVAAVIAAARLRRPVLVGWSLGGYVAGAYLRKHGPAGIAGINLVDAVTRLSPDLLTPLAGSFTVTATSPDLATRVAATADFLAACFHRPPSDRDFQRMLVVNGMTARAANEGFVRTPVPDLEPVFAAYAGPVLLTHGAHDRLVRQAMAERIQALGPGRRLSVFGESGHSPFYEEPERFGRELAAFVAAAAKA
ncbi:alpha/beta hydrolase [Methylobacterium sp. 17Sr1-1]|uniref:alpha/beta fold hydrolase n=1 Tax=Methylobacterium sp. 17Sr1-1 TaxID=2202826 RepID=UPI000D7031B9|nr:alpha/beta hydrolase [Methylobacterium sp. 17Sr1-1]AWN55220.1 alpha/beta hydrolase [Methylobacterium sp. 17Sr1-1]